ncbi:MAG: NADH-dependent dehydrogenase [Gemmatales bacterium]|nr:MAG: NADH-dependent dehydrogenase [Gemmatales bacterium]
MGQKRTRREFLQQTAAAGVGFWVAAGLTPSESRSALEKLSFAGIGVGGKGSSDIDQAGSLGDVVAICDIDDQRLEAKAKKFPNAQKFNDFREMLDKLGKKIDAVTVSTPDHTHAVASIMAMKMGKHVYCQKPLTHSVFEARMMREVARQNKVCTQMGNQGTAHNGLRRAVELIRGGVIGPVHEVHVWTNRPVWPQSPQIRSRPKPSPVPKHVHWDEWIGPAPMRPYSNAYHPFKWRGWWDFGTGALGDMGCHTANMAFMALKLEYPIAVSAENEPLNPETYPGWATVTLEFPSRGDMPPVKFYWYEGRKNGEKNLPPAKYFYGKKPPGSGSLLVGEKGVLYSPNDYGGSYVLLPEEKFKDVDLSKIPESLPRNGGGDLGMKREWVEAIKNNKPHIAMSNFDYASLLTEAILLGNVAMRVGKRFQWDGPNLKSPDVPEVAQYIKRPYRKGWSL